MTNPQIFRHKDRVGRNEAQLRNSDRGEDGDTHIWAI